jgi:hypothetical protein
MYRWQYSGVEGALVFVADKARGGLFFRVVDLSSGLGVIWDHELPKEIEYNQDKPFFHTWQADVSFLSRWLWVKLIDRLVLLHSSLLQ